MDIYCGKWVGNGKFKVYDDIEKLISKSKFLSSLRTALRTGTLEEIIMPNVVEIDSLLFSFMKTLKTVSAPKLKIIRDNTFSFCENLQKIDLGSVETIGDKAFYSCKNLQKIDLESVETIGNKAFYFCENLQEIDLGSVNKIGDFAFNKCSNLAKVSFNKKINSLPDDVSLYNFTILNDNGIQKVEFGQYIFNNCSKLPRNKNYLDRWGTFNNGIFTFNENIRSFPYNLLQKNSYIKKVDLKNIEEVQPYSFEQCYNLKIVEGKKLKNIGERAFDGCFNLTEVIGDEIETIGEHAFTNANNLETINLKNIKKILPSSFDKRHKIIAIKKADIYSTDIPQNVKLIYLEKEKFYHPLDSENKKIKIKDGVTELPLECFFQNNNIVEVDLNDVKIISERCFKKCGNLQKVTGKNITVIRDFAFYECKNLKYITLAKVENIGTEAFYSCENLESIQLLNLKSVGKQVFLNCKNLKSISFKGKIYYNHYSKRKNKNQKFRQQVESLTDGDKSLFKKLILGTPLATKYRVKNIDAFDKDFCTDDDRPPSESDPIFDLYPNYQFEKVPENEPLFSKKGPKASDICQGEIGDCWLLSTLSSLAKSNPQSIKQCLKLCDNGSNVNVLLYKVKQIGLRWIPNGQVMIKIEKSTAKLKQDFWDRLFSSFFSTEGFFGKDAFYSRHALWVKLLEKAFAVYVKDKKGFGKLQMRRNLWAAMYSSAVITAITGKPSKMKFILSEKDNNKIFNSILKRVNANKPITAGIDRKDIKGLPGPHAYSVLGVIENGKIKTVHHTITDKEHKFKHINKFISKAKISLKNNNKKYIILRNPHAGNGAYLDKNSNTAKIITNADGMCIIELSQFCKLFYDICYQANKFVPKR